MKKWLVAVVIILSCGRGVRAAEMYETESGWQSEVIGVDALPQDFDFGEFELHNLQFSQKTYSAVKGFGVLGTLKWMPEKTERVETGPYTAIVDYYDSDKEWLGRSANTSEEYAIVQSQGTLPFRIWSDGVTIGNRSVSDIAYFRVTLDLQNVKVPTVSPYAKYDYYISDYEILAEVNRDRTMVVTETIVAQFNKRKHGIVRTLPLLQHLARQDGSTNTVRWQVTDVSSNQAMKVISSGGNYDVRLGDANRYVDGEQTYIIKYTYNMGKDPLREEDEFYWNVIGTEWDAPIEHVDFVITMPEEIDKTLLGGVSVGKYGSVNEKDVDYLVEANQLRGQITRTLEPGEAVTVRLELPEGYFVGAGWHRDWVDWLVWLVPTAGLLLAGWYWWRRGPDYPLVETVEFYPPEGMNSLELGFVYHGRARDKDVTSLLIYLANQGYLRIDEGEKGQFTLTKIKDYDGDDENEKEFLRRLFVWGETVERDDLKNKFYQTVNRILQWTNKQRHLNTIWEKSKLKKWILGVMMAAIMMTLLIVTGLRASNINVLLLMLLSTGAVSIPIIVLMVVLWEGWRKEKLSVGTSIYVILYLLMMFYSWWRPVVKEWQSLDWLEMYQLDKFYFWAMVWSVVVVVVICWCLGHLQKRTQYGQEMLGKIKGFKRFLETARREQLETLVEENPQYFYDILPYTYVLGVSSKWIKKFETITVPPPTWTTSTGDFDLVHFGSFVNNTMTRANTVMTSSPSSSGGSSGSFSGGGGGGGFSGGGGGGGGGHSW